MAGPSPSELEVRLVSRDHAVAVVSVLTDAYALERTFNGLFAGHRPRFQQRLRAFMREYTRFHLDDNQSLLALIHEGRVIGAALFCAPGAHRLQRFSARSQLALLSTVGVRGAVRYLRYQSALKASMPASEWCFMPLVGVLREFQGQGYGRRLLEHAWSLSCDMPESSGIALGSGAGQAQAFYRGLGFQPVGELDFRGTRETFFFKAS